VNKKEKPESENRTTPKESTARAYIHLVRYMVPLPEALLRMLLPLSGKIVTTDVSRCDKEGARRVGTGGRVGNAEREKLRTREIKNASCGKDGDLEVGGSRQRTIIVRIRGPCVLELGPRTGPATGHIFFRQPPRHCRCLSGRNLCTLPNWQWVVPTRH